VSGIRSAFRLPLLFCLHGLFLFSCSLCGDDFDVCVQCASEGHICEHLNQIEFVEHLSSYVRPSFLCLVFVWLCVCYVICLLLFTQSIKELEGTLAKAKQVYAQLTSNKVLSLVYRFQCSLFAQESLLFVGTTDASQEE